ncbi:2'-5'-oligoadenylate synthase 2-like [Mercenaria mercenaria]|uniref:2'-5'-oligoadenylate synthase 2-like n=1 Tax=Mercenaria mercenaria TaxID=6596 RepID=UPI00234E694F|nr:2'-5'-oligoadenylate synthase 2-like [Mercenaria mercenaria]XP_053394159.1 2'-5'-oligoadenylate synthase 2-like [Mercenaria mercenaria]XP_053394160.1 2'-5'-oligoadenylate synthase 2-like [Mercenaria mercenaria]XP_053394161.1 2'-5'-oligoadenylate synthase 2-like [Mercenaria mercenaria]
MRNCPDCSLTNFLTKEDLRFHRREEHGFEKCDCSREFLKREYMEQHRSMSKVHIPGYYTGRFKCAECIKRFPKEHQLLQHQKNLCHKGKVILEANEDRTLLSTSARPSAIELSRAMEDFSIAPNPDLYQLQSQDIDNFIAHHVQADSLFLGCCGEVIDTLVRKLQEIKKVSKKLQPKQIIKSGSMGKGTAVKGIADIDLVLMLNEYTDVETLMLEMDSLLKDLERYLISYTESKPQKTTRYSVQVKITCSTGHKHDVDILPAVDLLGLGYSPAAVFRKMEGASKDTIHEYSVTLAPLQLEIISPLPAKIKNLIKLVKYWKNKKLKEKCEAKMPSFAEREYRKPNWPSSYALELVVINIWNEAGNPDNFDTEKLLHDLLISLINHRRFKILLKKQMAYDMDKILLRTPPYIMDPANPFNDMYHGLVGGEAFDWEQVVPEARVWLEKPLFYGVS